MVDRLMALILRPDELAADRAAPGPVRRVAAHMAALRGPVQGTDAAVIGGLRNIPVVGGLTDNGVADALLRPTAAMLNTVGLGLEASGEVGRAITGGGEALIGKALTSPVIRGREPEAQQRQRLAGDLFVQALAGYERAQGNPFQRARAANEAGAKGHEFEQGLYNAVADPSNALGPAAKLAEAGRLPRLARALNAANTLQNAPIDLAARKALGALAARRAATKLALAGAAEADTVATRNLPLRAAENIGDKRSVPHGSQPTAMPGYGGATVTPTSPPAGLRPAAADSPAIMALRESLDFADQQVKRLKGQGAGPDQLPLYDALKSAERRKRQLSIQLNKALKAGEGTPSAVSGAEQAPLTPATVNPGERPSIPLTEPLDDEQRDILDQLRDRLREGNEREATGLAEWARDVLDVPEATIASVKEETYRALDQERDAAILDAIERSPYPSVFQYFNNAGDLKAVNPITGKRIITRSGGRMARFNGGVGNVVGNGYDEIADNLIANAQAGGHNQNYGQTAEEFWINAQEAFLAYNAVKAGKPLPQGIRMFAGVGLPGGLVGRLGAGLAGGGAGAGNAALYTSGINPETGEAYTPEERRRAILTMGAVGAVGGAAVGPRLLKGDLLGRVARDGAGDLATQRAAMGRWLAETGGESLNAGVSPARRAQLLDIAPDLDAHLRGFARNPASFDPARFRAEALANDAADDLGDFFASNLPRLQAGQLSRDELLAALVPTRLSIRRGPIAEKGIAKVTSAYPELGGQLDAARIAGGADAGKVRPEDVAAILLRQSDEGKAIARAIKAGDHGGLARALAAFKRIWPGSLMGHELATFHDAANKLGAQTDFINARASHGASPGALADELVAGGPDVPRVVGIGQGKVPFQLWQIGAGQGRPTFDSKVIAALKEGATPATYRALLEQLYPWVNGDMGKAHQLFWDAAQPDLAGIGAQTRHTGLRDLQTAVRGGETLGAGLSPEMFDPERVGRLLKVNLDNYQLQGEQQITGFPRNRTDLGGTYVHPADLDAALDQGPLRSVLPGPQSLNAGLNAAQVAALAGHVTSTLRTMVTRIPGNVDNTLLDAAIWREAFAVGQRAWAASKGTARAGGQDLLKGADAQWRRQITATLRNLQLDAGTLWLLLKEFGAEYGVDRGAVLARVAENRANHAATDKVAKLGSLGRDLADIGLAGLIDDASGLGDLIGTGPLDALTGGGVKAVPLSAAQRTAVGTGIGLANGLQRVSPLTALTGGARGYFDPFIAATFGYLNGLQHNSFREALLHGAIKRDLPRLAGEFLDVLDGLGANTASLRAAGKFTPADVQAAVGAGAPALADQAAKEWATLTEALVRRNAQQVAGLAGNFADKTGGAAGKAVNVIGRVAPFSRWSIAYAPVLAKIALRHPFVATGIVRALAADAQAAKRDGRKGYTVGTLPISTETPVLGGVARARLGGAKGVVRLDPLALVSPWGGELIAGGDDLGDDATAYQRVKAVGGRVGINPHPLLQDAAFLVDQDYQDAGSLSRTAAVEGAAGAVATGLGLPTLPGSQRVLGQLRARINPRADPASGYDPALRRYAELVLAKTKKPLSDPSNAKKYFANRDPALWAQAVRETATGGLVGGLISLGTPLSATAQTTERVAADRAKALAPVRYNQLQAATGPEKTKLQKQQDDYEKKTPAAKTYTGATPLGQARAILAQWEAENTVVKRANPARYARERDALKKRLGLR